jgi:hypothetical protein
VLDLNANGTRGAGDGKIDQAKEVVLSLWGDAGRAQRSAVANVLLAKFVNGTKDDLIGWDLAVDVGKKITILSKWSNKGHFFTAFSVYTRNKIFSEYSSSELQR